MCDYYPKYKFIKENAERYFPNYENNDLHIYIDVRNAYRSPFYQEELLRAYDNMTTNKCAEITPFLSFIAYTIRVRNFYLKSMKFNNVKMFYFMDSGQSLFHKEISKQYKDNRLVSSYTIDTRIVQSYFDNLNFNYNIMNKILNYLPNIYFIKLKHLESDFVPYYLINNVFNNQDNIYHMIFSTDKDMLQTLINKNKTYQYIRVNKENHKLISSDYCLNYLLKEYDNDFIYLNNYFLPAMSIMGDMGDNVPGIKGIGGKTVIKILDYFNSINFTSDNFKDAIFKNEKLPSPRDNLKTKKLIDKLNDNMEILKTSYRLISFQELINYILIRSGKIKDEYNFGYTLNSDLYQNFNIIHETIDNENKIDFTYDEFIDVLKSIKGCGLGQFTYEELNNYFI